MQIKALVIGDYISPIHEDAICTAFSNNRVDVEKFKFSRYFIKGKYIRTKFNNFQIKYGFGPLIWKINQDLIHKIKNNKYDIVFFYRPRIIRNKTLKLISKSSCLYFYNNDDPFGDLYKKFYWKRYFSGLKYCDHIFYYREKNKKDYLELGYKNISLLRSYYIKYLNFPTDKDFLYEVVFIGHFENDGRDLYIKFLIDNNINIKIFGPEWKRSQFYNFFYEKMGHIIPLDNEKYNLTLNQSKIALVFLSTLNSDSYTRRCFEIPATKTFMLSQYSKDLALLFTPEKEADYFITKEELLSKIQYYLENKLIREKITSNAYEKLIMNNHEVSERIKIVINQFYLDAKANYA